MSSAVIEQFLQSYRRRRRYFLASRASFMPWLFCHIPKTAGTSFRLGLEEQFPPDCIRRDYGPDPEHSTAPFVSAGVEQDISIAHAALRADTGWRLLSGHLPIDRHASLFSWPQVQTFIRHPDQQLLSHWRHFQRRKGYTESLRCFAQSPAGAGIHRRMLRGVPLQLLGFVGVTERYAESLELFAASYGLEIPSILNNTNPNKESAEYAGVLPELDETAATRLRKDHWDYAVANRLLSERLEAMRRGQSWVHGAVSKLDAASVEGVAFSARPSTQPLQISISVSGNEVAVVRTDRAPSLHFDPGFRWAGACGFRFEFARPLVEPCRIDLRVCGSQQWLDSQHWQAAGPQVQNTPWLEAL